MGIITNELLTETCPGISNRHCAELERRYPDARRGGEYFVSPKFCLGLWWWLEHFLHVDEILIRERRQICLCFLDYDTGSEEGGW
jgi:hypothetical protein